MKTLAEWITAHSWVIASLFEKNYDKQSGSGRYQDVCGFCLASYRFKARPPIDCKFCRASIRETRSISDLPEIRDQRWRLVETFQESHRSKPSRLTERSRKEVRPSRKKGEAKKKLAILSLYEDKRWIFAFNYYLDRGKTQSEADKLAWRDLQLEFPHLRKYDGCKP